MFLTRNDEKFCLRNKLRESEDDLCLRVFRFKKIVEDFFILVTNSVYCE